MAQLSIANQTLLAVLSYREDRVSVQHILGPSSWKVRFAGSIDEARAAVHAFAFGAVMTDARFPEGRPWEDLLRLVQSLDSAPPLIVVDRLANEHLWAEVLNLSAHDLLSKPFNAQELMHVLRTACLFRENEERDARLSNRLKAGRSASISGRAACAAAAVNSRREPSEGSQETIAAKRPKRGVPER